MALNTNYTDDILASSMGGKRHYTMVNNDDNTVSFTDSSVYDNVGTDFGANDINSTNAKVNELDTTVAGLTSIANEANVSLGTAFVVSSSSETNSVIKVGRFGYLDISVKPTSTISTSATPVIGTIPSGYRPKRSVTVAGIWKGQQMSRVAISTSGEIKINGTTASVSTSDYLNFSIAYII